MTITTNPTRDEYTASAGQTVFNYTFKIFESTDLNVYVTPLGDDGNDSTDLTTSYTVDPSTIGNENGGFITFNTGLDDGDQVTIVSNIPSERTIDYQNNGDFRPDVVNQDFDRVVSLVKQVEDRTKRAALLQESQQGPKPISLPRPESGKFIQWNGSEDGFVNVEIEDGSVTVPNFNELTKSYENFSDMQASTIDWQVGNIIMVAKPSCVLEVVSPTGNGIPLGNGLEAIGVKQDLIFDSISDMKSQPAGLFAIGSRVEVQDYYSGWASLTVRDPYPFSGVISSDQTVLNTRGAAADNIGDHDLGDDINFLADTDEGYVNRVWGCRPGEVVDDNINLQAMFDAPRDDRPVNFKFVGGSQYISSSSQLTIEDYAKVVIESDGGGLVLNGTNVSNYGLIIQNCNFVKWESVDFNLNFQQFAGAVRIFNIRFQVKFSDSNFFNFANEDAVGFECAQQVGVEVERVNKNPATIANNSSPGMQMINCSFYNEAPTLDTSFDYNDNFCGGTGVRLKNDCEYWRITNCGFFGNCIGLWLDDAANGAVVNCEFQETLGVTQKSFIGSGIPEGGGVYIATTSDNNSKLNIIGCKFNHSWGFGVRSAYSSPNRPIEISNCQFIANSFIAVNITGNSQSTVKDCYFERAYNYLGLPSWPWAGFAGGGTQLDSFIYLGVGSEHCTITGNRGNDLPDGRLVWISATTSQTVSNNTVSSTVNNAINPFFNATPSFQVNNNVMG